MCEHHSIVDIPAEELTKKKTRRKLWDMDVHWHCAIIGTCLSHDELKKIAHKAKAPMFDGALEEYKMHSFMVSHARHSQGVGRLLHKYLERKFSRTLKTFAKAKCSEDVEALWEDARERGYIPGPFWAVMTHQESSMDLMARVYGEVHMLSHLEGASHRADERELADLKATIDVLKKEKNLQSYKHSKAIDKRDHLIGQLKADLQQSEERARKADELEAMLLAERDGHSIAQLEHRIDNLTNRVIQETDKADLAQKRTTELYDKYKESLNAQRLKDQKISELEEQLIALQAQFVPTMQAPCMVSEGCPGEQDPDLCGRCIAYVGGQSKQAAFLRDYVEKKNGQFLYHDGGLHDGQARLASIVAQADTVMFPVTCISHEATREIKRICNQQEIPFVPLRSQGLSAFAKSVDELVEN